MNRLLAQVYVLVEHLQVGLSWHLDNRDMRVLLVEDELRLAENVAAALRDGPGFAVDHAEDGETGLASAANRCYDLIVLDLMLPRIDGLTVLRNIRSRKDQTPVLILTARGETASKIDLLNAGADDYLSKPFDLGELLARVKALVRRSKGISHPILQVGDIELNTVEQTVVRASVAVTLSRLEFGILEYLMHRPRAVVSKQELLEHLYDYTWERHSNVVEAHVSNLRKKMCGTEDMPIIQTLRGRGYRLLAPAGESA